MEPENHHGDPRHITLKDLKDAAKANQQTLEDTLRMMEKTTQQIIEGRIKAEGSKQATKQFKDVS